MTDSDDKFAIKIRAAQSQDASRIAELATQLGYPSNVKEIAQRIEQLRPPADSAVFVAEAAPGEIAGWIGMFVFRSIAEDPRAEISGLVVDETFRSRGIGEKLLHRAEQWASEKGCGSIGLRCNVVRERAHAFYERHGYRHTKTQKSYRKTVKT